MNEHETQIRAIRDRIAAALGQLDDGSINPKTKSNYFRLTSAAKELHGCADSLQSLLMRIKPRA
jgi:hypothetical protein